MSRDRGSDMEPWVVADTLLHRPIAEFVRSVLEGHGIPARVRADDAAGTAPHVAMGMGGVRVEVPADRLDEAHDVLASGQEALEPELDPGSP